MKRIRIHAIALILSLSAPITLANHEAPTCSTEIRYGMILPQLGYLSQASVAVAFLNGFGYCPPAVLLPICLTGMPFLANQWSLSAYIDLLNAASIEHNGEGTPETSKLIDSFYEDITKDLISKELEKRASKRMSLIVVETPFDISKQEVISILHQLNTEPSLREECLKYTELNRIASWGYSIAPLYYGSIYKEFQDPQSAKILRTKIRFNMKTPLSNAEKKPETTDDSF